MFWMLFGVVPGLLAATAAFFTAAWVRPTALHSRPAHPVLFSLLAGLLWPILVIGLTEFAIVMAMPTAMHPRRARRQLGVAADTTAFAQR